MSLLRKFNPDFDHLVAEHGSRTAFINASDSASINYRQLDALIDRQLAWLEDNGVRPGQTVGALLPNGVEMLSLMLACLRGGLVFAPLSCESTAEEVQRWSELVKPALICYTRILHPAVLAVLEVTNRPLVAIVTDGTLQHLPVASATRQRRDGAQLQLFSSGTTGAPKAIVLDGDRLWSAGRAFAGIHGASLDTPFRIWNFLPQSYLGGIFNMALIPLSIGGSVVVDDVFSGRTFLSFWQTVERHEINVLWLVPSMVHGLLAIAERTRRTAVAPCSQKIDLAFIGTAPIDLKSKQRFEAVFGFELRENFALSETTFLTSELPGEADLRREGSTGRCLPYVELQFRPLADEDARFNEILARSPFLMLGYLDSTGALHSPTSDGFLATGDLGYLDQHGQLILTGRSREIIKKGGYLISLREIEVLAKSHELVIEAAAISTPHAFYGESYQLLVRLQPDAPTDAIQKISDFLLERLARHKWPEDIKAVETFARTASGKIRKFMHSEPAA